jgi:hypothetical protein
MVPVSGLDLAKRLVPMSGFRAGSQKNVSLGPGHKKTWPQ